MLFVLRERAFARPVLANRTSVLEYLQVAMGVDHEESLRVLFLNARRELLAEETMAQGGIDGVTVRPREIIRRALEVGATALVLVHNHPSGDPTPSASDRAFTRHIAIIAAALDITLLDHFVVGHGGACERI